MDREERQLFRATFEEAGQWPVQARSVLARSAMVEKAGDEAVASLRRRTVEVWCEGRLAWRILSLRPADGAYLARFHEHDLVADLTREGDLVRPDDHGYAGLGRPFENLEDFPDEFRVEGRRWFVEEHHHPDRGRLVVARKCPISV